MAPVDKPTNRLSSLVASALMTTTDPVFPDESDWARSCLVDVPDTSNIDLSEIKNALIQAFELQPDPDAPAVPPGESSSVDFDRESSDASNDEVSEGESHLFGEIISESYLKSVFQPHYNEDDEPMIARTFPDQDFNNSLVLVVDELDLAEDIFKVWDLPTLTDELEDSDLFMTQLDEAISEYSPFPVATLPVEESLNLNDLREDSLDDLIAILNDLSLDSRNPPSTHVS